jgi:uncharacterized protein YdaU (DUF1376 family)
MKSPAFQLYAADFSMDTDAWSVDEVGIYTRLLLSQWVNGDLPEDPTRLARIAKCSLKKFLPGWRTIQKKFVPCGEGKIQNRRLEETRHEQMLFREQQRAKGIKSGEKRREKANRGSNRSSNRKAALRPSSLRSSSFSFQSSLHLFSKEIQEKIIRESWEGFVGMRNRIRKPLTERAVALIGKTLLKLMGEGQDINAVLDQSTVRSYQDVFPVTEVFHGPKGRNPGRQGGDGRGGDGADREETPGAVGDGEGPWPEDF